MKITTVKKLGGQDVLVHGLFEEDSNYDIHGLKAELAAAVKSKRFSKKWGETYSTKVKGKDVVFLGLGPKKEITPDQVRRAFGKCVKISRNVRAKSLGTNIAAAVAGLKGKNIEVLGRAAAEGLILGSYSFSKYLAKDKQDKKKCADLAVLEWSGTPGNLAKGLKTGRIIAEATNMAKDWVNEPAGVCNSVFMEKAARAVARHPKIKIKVLGKAELKKLGMNSMLGVNEGSQWPPKMILLEYRGGSSKDKWKAILGKGITFDSGGYNLKPSKYIEDMNVDMGGSAAVLGTIKAVSDLGIKKNILGVMGMCENMVSDKAQHPGDIVRAMNGKTIQIGNTDAEGRLVLADCLHYTEKFYKPELMIDLATLTGACVVALGYYAAGMVGTDDALQDALFKAGEKSGDRVWKLPFFDDYQDWMDGSISDLNNISQKGKGYEAGSITAGVFLSKFVDKTKWAHLDIAGTGDVKVDGDYWQKGGTGAGVRVLSYFFLE